MSLRNFSGRYICPRYYDSKGKELYELKMGPMKNEEYTMRFLELFKIVPYLKDENMKVQRFFSGFPLEFTN